MSMDEMDAEFFLSIIACQNFSEGYRMIRKKRWLRFIGWKLIVPEAVLVEAQCWIDDKTYKLDDCCRSAKVGGMCKPGTAVCVMTETEAIMIDRRRYETGSLKRTLEFVEALSLGEMRSFYILNRAARQVEMSDSIEIQGITNRAGNPVSGRDYHVQGVGVWHNWLSF
jgi:hypothetical protein